jgi:hypothetical protein
LWRCGTAAAIPLAAALVVGIPGAAIAAEPGVHIDPGSPAGTEYALPLDQARHDATPPSGGHAGGGSGGGGGSSSGSGGSTLFGAGVVSRASSGSPRAGGGTRSSATAAKRPTARQQAGPSLPAAASTGSGADTSQGVLLAIAVLAAGCLSGLAARRLGRARDF